MAGDLLGLSLVCCVGLALGSIKIKGMRLGSTGVLFAGILGARMGVSLEHHVLEFFRDFGLVLFVFMMGLQLGPGFFDSLRREGLKLNAVALAVVLVGSAASLLLWKVGGFQGPVAIGLLNGATTNTPSLAAAQQALRSIPPAAETGPTLAATAYAVAYPIGVLGIVTSLVLIRLLFRIDVAAECAAIDHAKQNDIEKISRRAIRVTNPNLDGLAIQDLPHISSFRVRLSRHKPAATGVVGTARASTVLRAGDALLAVGTERELDDLQRLLGERSDEDLTADPGNVILRRVVVTEKRVVGERLGDLHLGRRFGVQVTRVLRGDIELMPDPDLSVRLGDTLLLVGEEDATNSAVQELGDSVKALNETHFTAIFLGIAAGLALGAIPLALPGLPAPVKLGLAGGPLLIAILAGRFGRFGPVVWHVPASANVAIRELGMTLFLACVGIAAGGSFFETVLSPAGSAWVAGAAFIALVGPLTAGIAARRFLKLNYPTLCGVIAGSTTDPPALAFANGACKGDYPGVAYATVYPLTMLMRIVLAQVMVLLIC